ncbi:MAG TPA: glycosyltransferase [Lacisediminihabitans sp.]|uniref:glycosyltransferase family 2 protein n=1 Tax=Lacisediminihabitans sp. TaxID=2787631 RepID=UPI002EDAB4F9
MTLEDWLDGLHIGVVVLLLALVGFGVIPILSTAYQFFVIPFHSVRNHYRHAGPYLPRVAVIIPAWNEGQVIGPSIDRLMALDYPADRIRIYVVDDASTDSTPEVVRAKAELYPGSVFHLRRATGGEGKAHTLNYGLREILRDDWMQATLIMDADVIYLPDSLRKMTRHLADETVGAVTAYIREGSADKTYLTRFIAFEYVLAQLAARRAQNVTGALACLAGGAQLHSRRNLEDLGGQIDTSTLAEDTITTFETQLRGRRAVFEPNAVVLAEEPQSIRALWKQRLRWARGNLQVTARYRRYWFRPDRNRQLGSLSFGLQWFSILLLPQVMVLAPIGFLGLFFLDTGIANAAFRSTWILAACLYVYTVIFALQLDGKASVSSWREAIFAPGIVSVLVMVTAFFPGLLETKIPGLFGLRLTVGGHIVWTIFVYIWISIAMVVANVAKAIEGTRVGFLVPILMYLVGYGPFLCAVTVDAYYREFRHADSVWEKTEKIGRVLG